MALADEHVISPAHRALRADGFLASTFQKLLPARPLTSGQFGCERELLGGVVAGFAALFRAAVGPF